MNTCENCLYEKACSFKMGYKPCELFKDKTDFVEVEKIERVKIEIIKRMHEFMAEWKHISNDSVGYWGGKVESMNIAKTLVNAALTDLCNSKVDKDNAAE